MDNTGTTAGTGRDGGEAAPAGKAPLWRRALRWSLRAFFAVLAALVLFEVALRIIFYPSFGFLKLIEPDPYRWSRFRANISESVVFKTPGVRGNRDKQPVTARTNSDRMRAGRDYAKPKPGGLYRVVCLGDSITFGWDLPAEATFPRLLEERLNGGARGGAFEVMNAGVPSYTTRQGLIWLDRDLMDFAPDLVVAEFGFNDAMDWWLRMSGPARFEPDREVMRGVPGAWEKIEPRWTDPVTEFIEKSHAGRIFLAAYSAMTREGEGEGWARSRVPPDDYRDNLLAIIEVARAGGGDVILISAWGTPPEYRGVVKEVGKLRGVPVIDQSGIVERAINDPRSALDDERMAGALERLRERHGEDFLKGHPFYFFLVDVLHPSEVSNILLVDELEKAALEARDKNSGHGRDAGPAPGPLEDGP